MSLTTHFASRTHFGWDDVPSSSSDFDFGPAAVPSFDHLFDQMHTFDCFLCRDSRSNFGRFNNNGNGNRNHGRHHSSHNNRLNQFQSSFNNNNNQQLALNDSPRNHKVTVDVTGFRPDSVKAQVQGNKLIVTAKEEERTGGDYSLRELRKTIDLPANADGARLTSSVRGGTLHIEVPLRNEQRQNNNDCYQRNDYGRNRSVERKNSFDRRDNDNFQLSRQRHHSSDRSQAYNESRVDVVHKFEDGPNGSVDDLTVTFTNNPGTSSAAGSSGFGKHQGSTSFGGNHGSTSFANHGSTSAYGSASAAHGSTGFGNHGSTSAAHGSTGFGNHGSTSFANHGSTSAKYDSHSAYHGSSSTYANYGSTSAAHGSSGYANNNHGSTGFSGSTGFGNHHGSTSAAHGSTGFGNYGSTGYSAGGHGSTGFAGGNNNSNDDDFCLAIEITLPERVDPSKVCVTVKDDDVIVKIEDQKQSRDGTSSFSFFQKHTIPRGADVNGIRCVLNGNKLTVKAPFAGRGGQNNNGRRVQSGQPLPIENGYGGSSRNF